MIDKLLMSVGGTSSIIDTSANSWIVSKQSEVNRYVGHVQKQMLAYSPVENVTIIAGGNGNSPKYTYGNIDETIFDGGYPTSIINSPTGYNLLNQYIAYNKYTEKFVVWIVFSKSNSSTYDLIHTVYTGKFSDATWTLLINATASVTNYSFGNIVCTPTDVYISWTSITGSPSVWTTIYQSSSQTFSRTVTQPVKDILYNNGLFVELTNRTINTSSDLQSWTQRFVHPNASGFIFLTGIKYNPIRNQYYVVGQQGLFATSPDAITWTQRNYNPTGGYSSFAASSEAYYISSSDYHFLSVTGNYTKSWNIVPISTGTFVAPSASYSRILITNGNVSSGIMSYSQSSETARINSITYSPTLNRYVGVGDGQYVYYSTDAVTWTLATQTGGAVSNNGSSPFRGVAWGNGRYVAVGGGYHADNFLVWTNSTTFINKIASSTTGLTNSWSTSITNDGKRIFTDVAYSAPSSRFVVGILDYNVTTPTPSIYYGSTGTSWTLLTLPSITGYSDRVFFTRLEYLADKNVFVGLTNKPGLFGYSTDGLNWDWGVINENLSFYSIIYGNNNLILGSDNAFVVIPVSSGLTGISISEYTKYTGSIGQVLSGSYSSSDGWLLFGGNSTVVKSADASTWSVINTIKPTGGVSSTLNNIAISDYDGTTLIGGSSWLEVYKTDGVSLFDISIPDPSIITENNTTISMEVDQNNPYYWNLASSDPQVANDLNLANYSWIGYSVNVYGFNSQQNNGKYSISPYGPANKMRLIPPDNRTPVVESAGAPVSIYAVAPSSFNPLYINYKFYLPRLRSPN